MLESMGLFKKNSPPPEPVYASNGAEPLSQERIIEIFREQKWSYFVDAEGDLGASFNNHKIYFFLAGQEKQILMAQGYLPDTFSLEKLNLIREFIENWHRQKAFMRIWYLLSDEGQLRLTASYTVDYREGVTNAQLFTHINLSVDMVLQISQKLHAFLEEHENN